MKMRCLWVILLPICFGLSGLTPPAALPASAAAAGTSWTEAGPDPAAAAVGGATSGVRAGDPAFGDEEPLIAGTEDPISAGWNPAPSEVEGLPYDKPLFPGAHYDPAVPTPEVLLGYPLGRRFPSPEDIARCLQAWSESSPRTRLVEYARTYEGRPLNYLIVTSPGNLGRLEEIQAGLARLADPRGLAEEEANRLLESLSPVGWFGYSIHGNETSGADAALAVIYHLAASTDPEVAALLDELVVIIDPLQNPDGRARFFKQVEESRGAMPNLDDQSLLHSGYWPTGRTNHYYYVLKRDWILGVHPETRGRLREIGRWRPMLLVDGHEMYSQDTYLFSPPRDPVNPNFPQRRWRWNEAFARDQAAAFDSFGWPYYHGEWNDEWYPGYASWAAYRGSIFILYEQARVAEDAVRRPGGALLSYGETVHHQAVSTMTNLASLRRHGRQLLREFLEERRKAVSEESPYAGRTFAILPSANGGRIEAFRDLMARQGIEVYRTAEAFTAAAATDQLGRDLAAVTIPAGSLLIPNRQPEAHLAAALLEFDPRMSEETLKKEREELLRKGESRMYDVTAWNLTMLFGLEALTLHQGLPVQAEPLPARSESPSMPGNGAKGAGAPIAWAFDGADDRSVAAAARLMERGVEVRVADEPFRFDDRDQARGSVLVVASDNLRFSGDLTAAVGETAAELGLLAAPVYSGLGEGELADLGGRHFRRLEPPSIALVARGGISAQDFGQVWHLLDRRLGIRHSHLEEERLGSADLQRYNVLVLPDRFDEGRPPVLPETLKGWVEAGGTLVAIGGSAGALALEGPGLSRVRLLPDVLDGLERYEVAVLREWLALSGDLPPAAAVWSHVARPGFELPWREAAERPEERRGGEGRGEEKSQELKLRDEWLHLFMPQGAFLASRVDDKSWLTLGCPEYLPILAGSGVGSLPVLMAAEGVEAPVRFGVLSPAPAQRDGGPGRATGKSAGDTGPAGEGIRTARPVGEGSHAARQAAGEEGASAPRVGWARLPEGYELRLRMSGLLWPEAAQRLANAAWVTREPLGRGQIILFATPPAFRGAALGTARLLMNALVYGPGFGTRPTIRP